MQIQGHPGPSRKETGHTLKVKLMWVENGVAFVEIINAGYLTQRMGSSGVEYYLASLACKLVKNRQIKKVNFIFEEGDHVVPGVYTWEIFADLKL